ncbi:MAG: undecaprenyldiphospho-muramoylpentapeptide beta-N-acetylglucosaminyltransferase [Bacilli bacterium]|nr:undecaprenyldiphospho-muramoylpentapeptide beta-N-acetylglucosaminyltransferase [Bacilli bacterium]
MKVIVSAGGTGGHIYPALAIIDMLKKEYKDLDILYIGTHNRMEKDIIPKMGIKYETLKIYGVSKRIYLNLKNCFLINEAFHKCHKIIKEFKPDLVIGAGGYVTYPVIKTAQRMGIKTFIHEQNSFSGKTNVALGKKATLVGVSFENSVKDYKKCKGKVFIMGNPCGKRALDIKPIKKSDIGFKDNKPLVVAVAGSLGSVTINKSFKEVLTSLNDKNYQFLYITGQKYYDEFIKGLTLPDNVKVVPYFENLSGLLKNTDALISRSGASTMSEVIALKVPTIFIPSPYVANNHQYYNAIDLVNKKAALMIEEKDFSKDLLLSKIDELLNNSKEIKNNLESISVVDSEKVFISEIKGIFK